MRLDTAGLVGAIFSIATGCNASAAVNHATPGPTAVGIKTASMPQLLQLPGLTVAASMHEPSVVGEPLILKVVLRNKSPSPVWLRTVPDPALVFAVLVTDQLGERVPSTHYG